MPRKPTVPKPAPVLREKHPRAAKEPKASPAKTAPPVAATKTKKKATAIVSKKTGEKEKRKSHPTYQAMIRKALKGDTSRKGTSIQAIYKFIEDNYAVHARARSFVKRALRRLVDDGDITNPTVFRYKLAKTTKKSPKKKTKKSDKEKKSKKSDKEKKSKKSDKEKKKSKKDTKEKKSTKKVTTKRATKTSTKEKVSPLAKVARAPKGTTKTTRGTAKKASKSAATDSTSESAAPGELKWVWQYFDGGFKNYDVAASDTVEGVYQEYLTSPYTTDVRSVKSGQWSYLVDFKQWTQQNIQHENHTTRKIRRVQIPASEATNGTKNYGGEK